MAETLSIRLNAGVKKRLENLAAQSKRSESFLAAKAIAAYVEVDEWQRQEIAKGIEDLDAGRTVSHEEIMRELDKWGKPRKSRR
jgi:RHH-type transcriptional regulator, rel operon repressor / antitoxin RelB